MTISDSDGDLSDDLKIDSKQVFFQKVQRQAVEFIQNLRKTPNNLSKEEVKLLSQLGKNKKLVITKADKGNAIVIQDRKDYVDKVLKILSDKTKFSLLEEDPTIKREAALQKKLLGLKNGGKISDEDYKKIRPVGSGPGILYGSCKVHKNDKPSRPVLRTINTFIYYLGKWLDELIKPIKPPSHHSVTDTFKFCDRKIQRLPHG